MFRSATDTLGESAVARRVPTGPFRTVAGNRRRDPRELRSASISSRRHSTRQLLDWAIESGRPRQLVPPVVASAFDDRPGPSPVIGGGGSFGGERRAVDRHRGDGVKSVRLFDFLQYDGQSWQVVAQDGPIPALKNLTSGRIRKVPAAVMLGDDGFLPDAPGPFAGSGFRGRARDAGSESQPAHRVSAPACGGSADRSTTVDRGGRARPRSEYDLRNSLEARVLAKAAELAAAGTPLSARS